MPSYKVHLVGGVASYGVVYALGSLLGTMSGATAFDHLLFLSFALFGSIFPDLDITSKVQRLFFLCMIVALPLALIRSTTAFLVLGGVCVALLVIGHRTITHQIWFLVLFPGALTLYTVSQSPSITQQAITSCIFFIVGGLSHRLLDLGPRRFFK